jgi:amino acid permease
LQILEFSNVTKTETLLATTLLTSCLITAVFIGAAQFLGGVLFDWNNGNIGHVLDHDTEVLRRILSRRRSLLQRPTSRTLAPVWNQRRPCFFSPQALILISILSTGYVAHYNAPRYYFELKDHTTGRFKVVVNVSFFSAAITYMCISTLGFLTFGDHSTGFVLDNYSYRDPMATLSRFGVALSVVFACPLLFQGAREGLWGLLGGQSHDEESFSKRFMTIILLIIITLLAIKVNDLTFVLSFGGATLLSTIIYIFPTLMFQSLVMNYTCMQTHTSNWEVKESEMMMWTGGLLGLCGAVVNIARTFF